LQHEDQREQHKQRTGDDLRHGACRGQGTTGELFLVVLQGLDRRLAELFDLRLIEIERAIGQPVANALDAGAHLLNEGRCALDELADNEGEDPADHRDAAKEDQRNRATTRSAAAIEEIDDGQQQRGKHRRQRDGYDKDLDLLHNPQHRDDRGEYHQQPPRPRGGLADRWAH
jgi:hypothetical protein